MCWNGMILNFFSHGFWMFTCCNIWIELLFACDTIEIHWVFTYGRQFANSTGWPWLRSSLKAARASLKLDFIALLVLMYDMIS